MLSAKKIETDAKLILENVLSESESIVRNIADNDKTPSFDGSLTLYKKEYDKQGRFSEEKENIIGSIDIQLKGKYIDDENELIKEKISYSVEISDLKNFRKKGGAIFFVVYFLNKVKFCIYHNVLLPVDLEDILSKAKDTQNNKSIKLTPFPTDADSMEYIFKNFIIDSKLQHSTANSGYKNLEYIKSVENLVFRKNDILEKMDFNKKIFNVPIYAYTPLNDNVFQPLSKFFIEEILVEKPINVKIDSKIYYSCLKGGRNATEYRLKIGESFNLFIPNRKEHNLDIKFDWKFSGTLQQRIADSEFLLALYNGENLEIENILNFKVESLKTIEKQVIERENFFYKEIEKLFRNLNICKELNFDTMTSEDETNLLILKKAIIDKNKVNITDVKYKIALTPKRISNMGFKLVIEKEGGDGDEYRIYNFFDIKYMQQHIQWRQKGKDPVDVPFCILLRKNDFLEIDNLNYKFIKDNIFRIERYTLDIGEHINWYIIEMLAAYDEKPNSHLLDCAIFVSNWLVNRDKSNIYYLNYLQAIIRNRDFNKNEIDRLIEIKTNNREARILVGVNILLNSSDAEIKYWFNKMSVMERDEFKQFPIFNLIKEKEIL